MRSFEGKYANSGGNIPSGGLMVSLSNHEAGFTRVDGV
jgi:hypothetical protein